MGWFGNFENLLANSLQYSGRIPQPCSNENYCKLSQMHACHTSCRFLLLSAKIRHPKWVAINVIPSTERTVLEYGETVIKNNW